MTGDEDWPHGADSGMSLGGAAGESRAETRSAAKMAAEMIQYHVYDHPSDFPEEWVVRRFRVTPGRVTPEAELWARAPTLDAARASIPHGLVAIDRAPEDDPVIFEVWL